MDNGMSWVSMANNSFSNVMSPNWDYINMDLQLNVSHFPDLIVWRQWKDGTVIPLVDLCHFG